MHVARCHLNKQNIRSVSLAVGLANSIFVHFEGLKYGTKLLDCNQVEVDQRPILLLAKWQACWPDILGF